MSSSALNALIEVRSSNPPVPPHSLHIIQDIIQQGGVKDFVDTREALTAKYGTPTLSIDNQHKKKPKDSYRNANTMKEAIGKVVDEHGHSHYRLDVSLGADPDGFGGSCDRRSAACELIDKVDDPGYTGYAKLSDLACSDRLKNVFAKFTVGANQNGVLATDEPKISVSPCGFLDKNGDGELASWTQSYLVCGSKLWVAWPLTPHNLRLYHDFSFKNDRDDDYDEAYIGLMKGFEGGVAILQQAGTTIHIPAFWPTICLSIYTATAISNSYESVTDYPRPPHHDRMHRKMIGQLMIDQQHEKARTEVKRELDNICRVIRNDQSTDLHLNSAPQAKLYAKKWDDYRVSLRLWVQKIEDDRWEVQAAQDLADAWFTFARKQNKCICPLCNAQVDSGPSDDGMRDWKPVFGEHFRGAHWDGPPPQATTDTPESDSESEPKSDAASEVASNPDLGPPSASTTALPEHQALEGALPDVPEPTPSSAQGALSHPLRPSAQISVQTPIKHTYAGALNGPPGLYPSTLTKRYPRGSLPPRAINAVSARASGIVVLNLLGEEAGPVEPEPESEGSEVDHSELEGQETADDVPSQRSSRTRIYRAEDAAGLRHHRHPQIYEDHDSIQLVVASHQTDADDDQPHDASPANQKGAGRPAIHGEPTTAGFQGSKNILPLGESAFENDPGFCFDGIGLGKMNLPGMVTVNDLKERGGTQARNDRQANKEPVLGGFQAFRNPDLVEDREPVVAKYPGMPRVPVQEKRLKARGDRKRKSFAETNQDNDDPHAAADYGGYDTRRSKKIQSPTRTTRPRPFQVPKNFEELRELVDRGPTDNVQDLSNKFKNLSFSFVSDGPISEPPSFLASESESSNDLSMPRFQVQQPRHRPPPSRAEDIINAMQQARRSIKARNPSRKKRESKRLQRSTFRIASFGGM